MNRVRADLPPLPARIAQLQVDERGYPVPFFVARPDGKPDFRLADPAKQMRCVRNKLCWVCGQLLNEPELAFTIGPMCALNLISADPPSHRECAEWSVKGCPFLVKPQMERREHEEVMAMGRVGGGIAIKRNPGVTLVWLTYTFKVLNAPNKGGGNGLLWQVGDPCGVSWWREGRPATRAEVLVAIETGKPFLMCEGAPPEFFEQRMQEIDRLLPKA